MSDDLVHSEASSRCSAHAELGAWLDAREPSPPRALRDRIDAVLMEMQSTADVRDRATAGSGKSAGVAGITSALGEAALHALRSAVSHCEERSAAIDLLAADALLTYMMEAAAEQGREAMDAAAEAYGNARLAQLVANADTP